VSYPCRFSLHGPRDLRQLFPRGSFPREQRAGLMKMTLCITMKLQQEIHTCSAIVRAAGRAKVLCFRLMLMPCCGSDALS
jgi:hypothetical protein